jgi:hypothetical protein
MLNHSVVAPVALSTFIGLVGLNLSAHAQQADAPPLVKQLNNGNWLPQKEAEELRDELFYQRAVHSYMTMLPVLNTIGMRAGWTRGLGCRRPTPTSSIP